MEPARITATDLACRRGDRLLFRGLSFQLEGGDALQVVGPNGTGKSSLLRILAGLLPPFEGTVGRQGRIALLDERLPLDGDLPLGRALRFWERIDRDRYGRGAPSPSRERGRGRQDGALGLESLLDVPVRYLSTGQRKRAAILQSNPRCKGIWLLDEPLNGLDVDAAAEFQAQVGEYVAEGGIAVIASHQPFHVPALSRLHLSDYAA